MKQSTVTVIEEKFREDIADIERELRKNKNEIKLLANKQRELKNTRKGLYDILRLIKG